MTQHAQQALRCRALGVACLIAACSTVGQHVAAEPILPCRQEPAEPPPCCRNNIKGLVLVKELALVDPDDCMEVREQRMRGLPALRADIPMYDLLKVRPLPQHLPEP